MFPCAWLATAFSLKFEFYFYISLCILYFVSYPRYFCFCFHSICIFNHGVSICIPGIYICSHGICICFHGLTGSQVVVSRCKNKPLARCRTAPPPNLKYFHILVCLYLYILRCICICIFSNVFVFVHILGICIFFSSSTSTKSKICNSLIHILVFQIILPQLKLVVFSCYHPDNINLKYVLG